jgi:DNA (cytosine-5)-methyltransferase 1
MLTHFSLFTGIGGLDLAAEWAGFTTVGQCEWADYPTKVLEKHWPDVPRWRDIREVTKKSVEDRGIGAVTVISGGFPCQPFSVAGNRKGEDDDRFLWPEMLRVVETLRPRWVVGENVAGIVTMALDQVLSDLESINYPCEAVIISACAVNAPHRRDRTFILGRNANGCNVREVGKIQKGQGTEPGRVCENVADTNSCGHIKQDARESTLNKKWDNTAYQQKWRTKFYDAFPSSENVSNTTNEGLERFIQKSGKFYESSEQTQGKWSEQTNRFVKCNNAGIRGWWDTEPDVGRVANGIPNRVDRLKCLGNAVVPQQAYPIFQAIADIERGVT